MRRPGILAAFLLAAIGMGAGFSGSVSQSSRVSVDRQLGHAGTSYHAFTRTEYLAPRLAVPKASLTLCFADGDSSFATFVVPTLDSLRDGTGRWGDSTFSGADLRATTWIMPSQTGVAPGVMTVAQVQALGGRQKYYELGSHGPDEERFGSVGMDAVGGQVSYAGVTGMSREFLRATLSAYQDSAAAWGIPSFRSHGYSGWKMQLGMSDIWEDFGYFQCGGISHQIGQVQTDITTETSVQQRNDDPFFTSVYGYEAPRYGGMHRIGEPFNPYDVGLRSSWQYSSGNDNGSTDSLKVYTDIVCQHKAIGMLTFHNVVPNGTRGAGTTEGLKIEESELLDLIYFWASRVSEGSLRFLTFEQAVSQMRGIRDGNLIDTDGFKLLQDSRVTSRLTASIDEPVMFVPTIGANAGFYGSGLDTLVAPQTGSAGSWKVWRLDTSDTVSAAFTAYAAAGSTSYGVASSVGNILIQQGGIANTDGVSLTIMTSGSNARYLHLAVQGMATNEPSPNQWSNGTFFMGCKAGQFSEIWEDNVNSGINSYESMADVIGWRTAPDYTGFAVENQRVRPQFTFWYADTTATSGTGSLLLVTESAASSALTSVMAQFQRRGTNELPFYAVFDRSASWDLMRSSFGNFGNPGAAGNADEAVLDNLHLIQSGATIRNWLFQIPINERTDYVQVHLSVERNGGNLSANGDFAVLNLEAYPIR